jgi:hypothetical protein
LTKNKNKGIVAYEQPHNTMSDQVTHKAIGYIEYHTIPGYGGSSIPICMFRKEIHIEVTLQDWLELISTEFISSHQAIPNLKPTHLKLINANTFSFISHLSVPTSSDSIEYYRTLFQDGWIPNIQDAHLIRQTGYSSFLPELFQSV